MTATLKGDYKPVVSILVMDKNVDVTRLFSPPLEARLNEGDTTTATVIVDDLTLTPGDYAFSVALFKSFDANDTSTAKRFEILGRSFELKVVGDAAPGLFTPAASWSKG